MSAKESNQLTLTSVMFLTLLHHGLFYSFCEISGDYCLPEWVIDNYSTFFYSHCLTTIPPFSNPTAQVHLFQSLELLHVLQVPVFEIP